jgi:Asp-tRNA(Asn)/Glu-tRNA(Gln) amidotransferase A subunit family amidase
MSAAEVGAGASLAELAERIRARELSPVELVDACLDRCRAADEELHAFLTMAADRARAEAARAEREVAEGAALGALHGIPIAVKDLQETAGIRTTYGSLEHAGNVPDEDCAAVERLRRAGAIVVGKTNTCAWGMLGETTNRLGPDARNPHDTTRTPGGSSGGSAAAVAAGLVPLATGTDSAGSITAPASMCGVFGMKPTHGLVPMWPVGGDSLLMNDCGPLTRSVADAAVALDVLAGHDARDPMSLRGPAPRFAAAVAEALAADRPLAGLRVAYSPDLGHFAVDAEVTAVTGTAATAFARLGAKVEAAAPELPSPMELYMPIYATDVRAGFGASLDGSPDLYDETLDELAANPPMTAEAYVAVLNRLWRFRAAAAAFFAEHDLLLTPATAVTAFAVGEPPARIGGRDVTPGWASFMPFSSPWNLTGQPAASVPCGVSAAGLPVGLMIVGRLGEDELVLRAAAAFQQAAG